MADEQRGEELESGETWDWDAAKVVKPRPKSGKRTVVSVAFNQSDFELVASFAEQTGKKISEFIRESAVQASTPGGNATGYVTGTTPGSLGTAGFTRVSSVITHEQVSPQEALTA